MAVLMDWLQQIENTSIALKDNFQGAGSKCQGKKGAGRRGLIVYSAYRTVGLLSFFIDDFFHNPAVPREKMIK